MEKVARSCAEERETKCKTSEGADTVVPSVRRVRIGGCAKLEEEFEVVSRHMLTWSRNGSAVANYGAHRIDILTQWLEWSKSSVIFLALEFVQMICPSNPMRWLSVPSQVYQVGSGTSFNNTNLPNSLFL